MSAPDELYPPTQYGGGWLLLALGILALLMIAAWLVVFFTRPKQTVTLTEDDASRAALSADVLSMLRTEYTDRIGQIEADYRSGDLSARNANLELSRVIRTFVNEYSGLEAPVLALDDLRRLGVQPALIDAMTRFYYPSIFRKGPSVDPIAGAEAARRVVASWH